MSTSLPVGAPGGTAPVPDGETLELRFAVGSPRMEAHAAVPTLRFDLRVDASGAVIRSVSLNAQVRIVAPSRRYDDATKARLGALFGEPANWGRNLRDLFWLEKSLVVPAFTGSTTVPLRIPCTYNFDVTASKYLNAVRQGDIPLEFLFSGSVFYKGPDGRLIAGRLSWESEARCGMPAGLWRELLDHHWPDTAWLRVRRDTFEKLNEFRARQSPPTWDAALEALLENGCD